MEEAGRPLNLVELAQRLEAEGCNPGSYALGTRGSASDAFCLIHDGTAWQVFYTERGVNQEPFYTAASEVDACVYFFDYITRFRHDHCVGFFRTQQAATDLRERLALSGVATHEDVIPYSALRDRRYRVFVTGKDIFVARRLFTKLPLGE